MTNSAHKRPEGDKRETPPDSKEPRVKEEIDALTEALEDSFPASDPPSITQPATSIGAPRERPLKKG